MALRTNSKEVRKRIREYVVDCYNDADYPYELPAPDDDFPIMANRVLDTFETEYCRYRKPTYNMQEYFEEWLSGLPNILNCDYYYGNSAIDVLGDILEETEEERNKFTEEQAQHLMTSLIYRELLKVRK